MRVFNLPNKCEALLFDMDSTLYTNEEYANSQIDLLVERLAHVQSKTSAQMKYEIDEYRKNWAAEHEGKAISLGNVFKAFGVSMEDNIRWREELCQPEKYLCCDKNLRSALLKLSSCFALAVVTNNPVSIATRTFSVLGISDILNKIVGLNTFGISKPHEILFKRAAQLCCASIEHCISIGDRYDIDIALPIELGMGGIQVKGVEDIYKLPQLLMKNCGHDKKTEDSL